MNTFIQPNFLLQSDQAVELYHSIAKEIPIYDYHCHLDPESIATNKRFNNLAELWLEGDHYKWRAMRANGVPEEYCTGNAEPFEKFLAFSKTLPNTLRNPLYHWSHLELKRVFGIDTLLNEDSAEEIWREAESQIQQKSFNVHNILNDFNVDLIGTTDNPTSPLEAHKKISTSSLKTKVFPTFREDTAFQINNPQLFNEWVHKLEISTALQITSLEDYLTALDTRHQYFHAAGCRMSDQSMTSCPSASCTETEAKEIFNKIRTNHPLNSQEDEEKFRSFMLLYLAELDHKRGWVRQFRIGVIRNLNTGLYDKIGADIGCDSITDISQTESLALYLGELSKRNKLPKMILYNLNPATNYALASMAGNFQDDTIAGKVQFGSGWWFLDQKEGMEWQMNTLSSVGLLSNFVGMVTDSRSFMSYPRHEYFRRILCNLIGNDMRDGLIPDDIRLVSPLIKGICYNNAKNYFGME